MKARLRRYLRGVQQGKLVAGSLVKQAVERHFRDLKHGKKRGLRFDQDAAEHAVRFFESYLYHTTGRWAGRPFLLEGWQLFVICSLFGWKRKDGTRRFRIAYIEVARKNGKSTLAAGISCYCLIADGEVRAEVYSAATKKDQAKIVFHEAKRMIRSSAELKRFCKLLTHNVSVPETYSKMEALGADSDTMDGLNVHCVAIDELHAHKSRNMWDVLLTATGARTQPLIFAITTAGFDRQTVCWEVHEYSTQVLEGKVQDDAFFAFIATLDDGDWEDESTWIKANPNLGVSVMIQDLREECERVKNDPRNLNSFLRYKLNRWVEHYESWLTPEQWAANNHGPLDLEALKARPCVAGLDLAARKDTTSLVLVFPPEDPEDEHGLFEVLPFIFIPGDTIFERQKKERVPWTLWKKQGHVITTSGVVSDIREIIEKISQLDEEFNIGDLVFDRWQADLITPFLVDMGWSDDPEDDERHLIEFGQGFKSMSPACRIVEELALAGRLSHGGHPVLEYMMSCVALAQDDAENIKPSKRKSTGRIDAVVAMSMAVYHASLVPEDNRSRFEIDPDAEIICM